MTRLVFWYEFASTYSYLSAMRIEALAGREGLEVVWRPFLLGPIFRDQGWESSPFNEIAAKGTYMWRDMERLAEGHGLPPLVRPDPFPQHSLLAARIATIGTEEGWAPAFTRAVYQAEFAEGLQISDPAVLAGLLKGIGQDASVVERAKTDQAMKDLLRTRTEEAIALGLFGAPSFVTEDGELFWGDDRLEQAMAWAQKG
ncbi:MAG: 2-hydroxychromene-2-carboxylate isomerase [Pseudomonadota bacterium]